MRPTAQTAVPALLIGVVLMMVVPVPPVLLDLLLAANIALAIIILLRVMTLTDSLQLSVFPSLLLMTTMVRLGLNVSSTRLILLQGYAGKIIETFGEFVVGGSVVVGLVVFLILIVIQFLVITNGAGRVAEVAARFTLDAMPGKQMAIDADLSAGLIDERQAREQRERIAQEADFFGAMDGASKFVKGDATAGIIIVAINLIGGFVIGVVQSGLPIGEAMATYTLLTVGDGLVSQIPALLISVSTGLLVTRVGDSGDLGPAVGAQLLKGRGALRLASLVILGVGLLPGLPKLPFAALALAVFVASARQTDDPQPGENKADETPAHAPGPDEPEALVGQMRVEPLELHLAYDILDLIDPTRGGDLLDRVRALRQQVAMELGVIMPSVRTRDDVSLAQTSYRVLVHGVQAGTGTAPRDRALALPAGDGGDLRQLSGEETVEPVFGLQAYWIPLEARAAATAGGSTVVDRSAVIVTHLAEVVRTHAAGLLTRQQVQLLLEGLRVDEPLLANEVGTDTLPLSLLHEVLRGLLEERVSVRDLGPIVEAVASKARDTRAVEPLIAAARVAVGAAIVDRVAPGGRVGVVTCEPGLEQLLHESLRDLDGALHLAIDPRRVAGLLDQLRTLQRSDPELPVVVVVGQLVRRPLQRLLAGSGLDLTVLAYPELPTTVQVIPEGVLTDVHIDA